MDWKSLIDENGHAVIPDGITKIGEIGSDAWRFGAFSECTNLTSIEIPDSVTEIGMYAFHGCTGLTSIEIPDSVTEIGMYAFHGCTGLTSIEIPNSVTKIGKDAFNGCTGLTSIAISNCVTKIEERAFSDCTSLSSIEIPHSVSEIGNGAFDGCAGLTSVEIHNSITKIGGDRDDEFIAAFEVDGAFSECTGLIKIEIPDSVTEIGYCAFYGCAGLTSIEIPNSVTKIGDYAFSGCTGLTSIEIPNSVTEIGASAFSDCTNLTSIKIPDSVKIIGNAFNGCTGLKKIEIPNSVTKIGYYAFSGCTGLTSINIPNSVTAIGIHAFSRCTGLTKVDIPNSVTKIGACAFYGCAGLTRIEIPDSITKIGDKEDYYGLEFCLEDIDIPDSVSKIGEFYGCAGLTSVEIPNSVTVIGECAFYGCAGLTRIEIPNSVTKIGKDAFRGCTGLTSIEIPNSVTEIGDRAFFGCTGLRNIEIPDSVTKIGDHAFYGCSGLIIMAIGEEDPENCPLRKCCLYGEALSRITLYVPIGTGFAYRQHPFFGQFKEINEEIHKVNTAVHDFDSEFDDAEGKIESSNKQDSFIIPVNAQELLVDYDYKSSSEVDDYPFYYSPLLGTPIFPYRRRKILREGVSEQSFYLKLKKYIDCEELSVYNDVSLQVSNQYHYEPDIAVISTAGRNLRIDIEIDEPYSGYGRTPIHCIGYDDTRDQTLVNLGWLVIRFSEEQIVTSPLNCIKFISKIISDIQPSFEVPERLLRDVNNSKESFYFVPRWTKDEAIIMASEKYRELYLNRSGFGYVENLSDATETTRQTITESILSTNVSIETNITSSENAQVFTSSCEQTPTVYQTEDEARITEYVKTRPQTIITLPKQRENRIEVISPYDSTIEEIMRPYFSSMSQDAYIEYDKDQHRLEQEILLYYGSNKRKFTESTAFGLIKEYIKTNNMVPRYAGMQIGHPSYHITGRIGFVVGDTLYDAKILRLGARGEDMGLRVAASLGDVPRSRYEIEETIKAEIVEQILNTSIKNMVILEVNLRTNRVSEVKLRRNKVARFILNDGKYDMSIRKI